MARFGTIFTLCRGRSQGLNSGLIYYPFSLKYPPDDTYWNGSPLAGSHNAYIVSKCKNVEKGMPRKEPDIDQSLLESSPTKEEVFTASDEILNARKLPDDSTLLMLADGFMKEGEEGEEVFKLCNLKDDLALSTVSCVALIHKSTKSGKLSDAYNFFRALRNKGVVPDLTVYNSLLTAAGKAGNFKLAYHIFKDLLANGSPDSTSYLSIAKAFTKVGDAEVACKFCRELSEQSCPCNATVLNRFIYAFSVTGQTKTSLGIFEDMKHLKCKPDQVTYNTIIDVLGKTGQADATFREFSTMKELGHVPDIITYNTLINNFSRLGRLDLCLMLLQEMTGRGIEPDLRTYTALIDSFGRMGQIEEAMKLFHEMKERGCLASIYVYRSLINNLRKAGNMDLANNLAEEMKVCSMKLIHPCNFKRKRR